MVETATNRAILRWLRGEGFWATKVHGDPMQERGVPDILACIDGRFLACETKELGEEPSSIQLYQLSKIREALGVTVVPTELGDVQRVVAEILKETRR